MCVNGGQYKTQSKGIRPQQRFVYKNYIFYNIFDTFSFSSYRSNCPVVIRIRPDAMGEKLVIKSFVSEHNHICTKVKIINLELSFNYKFLSIKHIFVRLCMIIIQNKDD